MKQLKNYKSNSGFSLIELLVAIVVFGLLGIIASQTLFTLLQGASKTEVVKEVKQNGDYALSVMEIKIRGGTVASTCNGTSATSLTITNPDQTTNVFSCFNHEQVNKIRQNDGNYLTNTSVSLPSCTTTDIAFTCTDTNGVKSILIKFNLRQAQTNPAAAAASTQTFQTQVTLRNK